MSALFSDQPEPFQLHPAVERLYKRVRLRYPWLYGITPEPVKVSDYPQTAAHLTQAEIDQRWQNYPKSRGFGRYLRSAGANAKR